MSADLEMLRKQMGFSDTLTQIFDLVRDNFSVCMRATLRICGPWLLLSAILATSAIVWFSRVYVGVTSNDKYASWDTAIDNGILESAVLAVAVVLLLLLFYGITSAIQTCITYVAVKHFNITGETPTFEVIKHGVKKYFWKVLLGSIISTIMVQIASQFFYLPGVFISVPLAMMVASMVADDASLSTSLSNVFTIIKNRWWFSFGILLVTGMAQTAVAGIAIMPVLFVYIGLMLLGLYTDVVTVVTILLSIAALLTIAAFTVFGYIGQIGHMVLFYSNSELVTGAGLKARVEQRFPLNNDSAAGEKP